MANKHLPAEQGDQAPVERLLHLGLPVVAEAQARETMAGMARVAVASGTRLEGEVSYGLLVGCRFVWTPRVGLSTSEYERDDRRGYGLGGLNRERLHVELGFDAQR